MTSATKQLVGDTGNHCTQAGHAASACPQNPAQTPVPWTSEPTEEASVSPALEAFARVLVTLLDSLSARPSARPVGPMPMLTVQQTAALLGMSRMTVIRRADAGELPCVVVSRGTRQRMRRFPRAAIEQLAAIGGGGAQVELTDYTAGWLAVNAAKSDPPGP